MANADISRALNAWPADRFPEGFRDYWTHRFSAYPPEQVADAIDAVRMDADPFAPTCAMVEAKLRELGVKPTYTQTAAALQYRQTRTEGEIIARRHAADNAVCEQLDDAMYTRLAEVVLRNVEDEIVALLRRKPLRNSQLIRSMVADHARVHRLVPSKVLEKTM